MKTKVLIIAFLIMALLGAFSLTAHSQVRDSTLIADETSLTYLKTGAKLITYSESIFKAVSLKFGDQFKSIHIYYKNDRHGPYKEYCIYLSTEVANNIKNWSKSNL